MAVSLVGVAALMFTSIAVGVLGLSKLTHRLVLPHSAAVLLPLDPLWILHSLLSQPDRLLTAPPLEPACRTTARHVSSDLLLQYSTL